MNIPEFWPPSGQTIIKRTKCNYGIVENPTTKMHVYFERDTSNIMDARDKVRI